LLFGQQGGGDRADEIRGRRFCRAEHTLQRDLPRNGKCPSLHDRLRATGDYDQAMADFIARQPMGRIGSPEEIAALALYLASDESAFTTGQTFVIDGGWAI